MGRTAEYTGREAQKNAAMCHAFTNRSLFEKPRLLTKFTYVDNNFSVSIDTFFLFLKQAGNPKMTSLQPQWVIMTKRLTGERIQKRSCDVGSTWLMI